VSALEKGGWKMLEGNPKASESVSWNLWWGRCCWLTRCGRRVRDGSPKISGSIYEKPCKTLDSFVSFFFSGCFLFVPWTTGNHPSSPAGVVLAVFIATFRTSLFEIAPSRSSFLSETFREFCNDSVREIADFSASIEVLSNVELNRMESEFLDEIKCQAQVCMGADKGACMKTLGLPRAKNHRHRGDHKLHKPCVAEV
jgi:hypothetical protein